MRQSHCFFITLASIFTKKMRLYLVVHSTNLVQIVKMSNATGLENCIPGLIAFVEEMEGNEK